MPPAASKDDAMIVKKIDMHMHCSDINEFNLPMDRPHLSTPEDVRRMYDVLGVEKGLVLPGGATSECLTNIMSPREVRAMVSKYSDTIGWYFASIDPRNLMNSDQTDFTLLMMHYKAMGARGISELTANMYLDDPKMLNFFKYCEKCEMPVILHFGKPGVGYGVLDDLHLPRLDKVLTMFPKLIIMGHSMAFWAEFGDDVTEENRHDYFTSPIRKPGVVFDLMRRHKNLVADLSAMSGYSALMRDTELTYRFFDEFQDNIVYATDIAMSNWIDMPQANLSRFLDEAVESGKISQSVYEKICRGNALRILKEVV